MRIELEHEPLELPLAVPFTIARGTRAVAENVLVRLTWEAPDGRRLIGLGEAAPNAYYGENVATVRAALDTYAPLLGDDPLALEAILARLSSTLGHNAAARAAIDMALHDLAGQLAGLPLWRWWGLERDAGPLTSFTIGLAAPSVVAQRAKAAAAADFPLLKIKLGSGDVAQDRAILAAVREATSARLMVDANAAWSPQEAVQLGPDLVAAGVELLEQPVAARDLAGMAHVHAHVPLPLIADESCVVAEDVPRIAPRLRRHQHQADEVRRSAPRPAPHRGCARARATGDGWLHGGKLSGNHRRHPPPAVAGLCRPRRSLAPRSRPVQRRHP